MNNEYRKEFFDRDYTVRESAGRLWHYMSRYKWRLFLGIFLGLVNAGILVPFYQVLQPTVATAGGEPVRVEAKVSEGGGKMDKSLNRAA